MSELTKQKKEIGRIIVGAVPSRMMPRLAEIRAIAARLELRRDLAQEAWERRN